MALDPKVVISGSAYVLDGDTIEIEGVRIRIYGIDAPESLQECDGRRGRWNCGGASSRAMKALVERSVKCVGQGIDAYGRLLASCVSAGKDVGAEMVRSGMAWAFVKYSDAYVIEETSARVARRGVFEADNQPPWDFRAAKWTIAVSTLQADKARACPIKGNISRSGSKIYHLPWQYSYAKTRIDENSGERWFCSESEAVKAGWRAAR